MLTGTNMGYIYRQERHSITLLQHAPSPTTYIVLTYTYVLRASPVPQVYTDLGSRVRDYVSTITIQHHGLQVVFMLVVSHRHRISMYQCSRQGRGERYRARSRVYIIHILFSCPDEETWRSDARWRSADRHSAFLPSTNTCRYRAVRT